MYTYLTGFFGDLPLALEAGAFFLGEAAFLDFLALLALGLGLAAGFFFFAG